MSSLLRAAIAAQRITRVPQQTPFFVGNGTTGTFAFKRQNGLYIPRLRSVDSIYRTDWQGQQLLYATSRTNAALQSANLTLSPWSAFNATVSVGTIKPDTVNALTVITAAPNGNRVAQAFSLTSGNKYTFSFLVEAGTSNYAGLVIGDGTINLCGAIYALTGNGVVVSTAGSVSQLGAITPIGSGLYLISISFTSNVTASVGCGVGVSDGSTYASAIFPSAASGTINTGFAQFEGGSVATSRINTTSAALTLTDYTLSGISAVLAQIPAVNATGDWSGTYWND